MSFGDWYIAAVSLGTGVSIPIWWALALRRKQVPEIAEGRKDIWFHIAAELATAAMLIAGGVAILVDAKSRTGALLSAFGLGMLAYSLIHSPGPAYDRRDRKLLATFAASWVAALPAIIVRLG